LTPCGHCVAERTYVLDVPIGWVGESPFEVFPRRGGGELQSGFHSDDDVRGLEVFDSHGTRYAAANFEPELEIVTASTT